MDWYPILLCLTIASAAGLTLIGRAAALTFRVDALDGNEPEHWLGCTVFGTGLVTLFCGWCSYLGMGANEYRWIVLGAAALLLFLALLRAGPLRLLPTHSTHWHLALWAILILRACLYLLPVLNKGSHLFVSDAMIYVPAADWLQWKGFGLATPQDPEQPTEQIMVVLHELSHRMGPIFLLSLFASIVPDANSFELFPVAIGLAAMLNVGAVYLICRWCFRIDQPYALSGLLAVTLFVHTLGVSTSGTFLCQVYGTAMLGTAIAVMGILREPGRWTTGNAFLVGSLVAFQMSMYSELTPVLVLVGGVWLITAMVAARRDECGRRLAQFLFVSGTFLALMANIEILRSLRSVMVMLKINGVGFPVPWNLLEFGEFAVGGTGFDYRFGAPFEGWKRVLCDAVPCLLFVVGLREIVRNSGLFVGTALVVFVGLFVYFAYYRTDPWSGLTGHTWNLFKITKWAYPVIAAIQVAGAAILIRLIWTWRIPSALAIAVLAVASFQNVQQHRKASKLTSRTTFTFAQQESPYDAVRRLRAQMKAMNAPVYLARPAEPVPDGPLMVSLLPSARFMNGWRGDGYYGNSKLLDDLPDAFGPETIYLQLGTPPFEPPLELLPFNISRLDPARPTLFRINDPKDAGTQMSKDGLRVGPRDLNCWILATRDGSAEFAIQWGQPPDAQIGGRLTIAANDSSRTVPIDRSKGQIERIALKRGINRITLTAPDGEIPVADIRVRWKDE